MAATLRGDDPGAALRFALSLTGEAVGEDVLAFVAASRHGAKIHRRDDASWVALDLEGTPMWTEHYPSREEGAWAYCRYHQIRLPRPVEVVPAGCLASEYARVAYEVSQELMALHGDEIATMMAPPSPPRLR